MNIIKTKTNLDGNCNHCHKAAKNLLPYEYLYVIDLGPNSNLNVLCEKCLKEMIVSLQREAPQIIPNVTSTIFALSCLIDEMTEHWDFLKKTKQVDNESYQILCFAKIELEKLKKLQ